MVVSVNIITPMSSLDQQRTSSLRLSTSAMTDQPQCVVESPTVEAAIRRCGLYALAMTSVLKWRN